MGSVGVHPEMVRLWGVGEAGGGEEGVTFAWVVVVHTQWSKSRRATEKEQA
jgi:hypothetical protein